MTDAIDRALNRPHRRVVALPDHDPVIEATPRPLRLEIASTWERRAREELKVAASFTVLCRELIEVGAAPNVLGPIARGVQDEIRHAEVCRRLAEQYRGAEVAWPQPVVIDPAPAREDRMLRTAFHAISMCCINEAIAATYLQTSLEDTRAPSAKVVVGELLADEVEHARAGWTFVATAPAPIRAAIQANLTTLAKPVVNCWWEVGAVTLIDGAPAHGIPSLETTRRCALDALRDIVIPGFESVGIDARELADASRWSSGSP
jgi:hypothetical protein